MPINAVSILEIRIRPGAEAMLEQCLPQFAARLRKLPGYVAFGVTQSMRQPRLPNHPSRTLIRSNAVCT